MSLRVISFTRPSPALVVKVTNTGVRRPGYEANTEGGSVLSRGIDAAQQCNVIMLVLIDVGHDVITTCKTENLLLLSIFSVSAFILFTTD